MKLIKFSFYFHLKFVIMVNYHAFYFNLVKSIWLKSQVSSILKQQNIFLFICFIYCPLKKKRGFHNFIFIWQPPVCTATVFALSFSPTCLKAKFRKKKKIYSTKFFHNFHLSDSSFTCPGFRQVLARKLLQYNCDLKGALCCQWG